WTSNRLPCPGLSASRSRSIVLNAPATLPTVAKDLEFALNAPIQWNPRTYLDEIRAEMPRYDELQEAAIDAIPFPPKRALELGFGTAETTRRLWERYPDCQITGLDASPEMVFHARELGWEQMRLGRI